MVGACSTYGERRGVCRYLVWVLKGKGPLGRPRRTWEDNIKMDLQEVEWGNGLIMLRIGTGGGLL
jgi:hypothetical protein